MDAFTGAPFRRAISEMQHGRFSEAPKAAFEQFGADPVSAPSMEDIAV